MGKLCFMFQLFFGSRHASDAGVYSDFVVDDFILTIEALPPAKWKSAVASTASNR